MAEADRWLDWAGEDIELAEYALSRGMWRPVCIHAQQAAEKALEGMLDSHRGGHPRVHSLEALLLHDPAVREELGRWRDTCQFLDVFYSITRYPDALPGTGPGGEPTPADAERALRAATALLADVRARMGRAT